MNLKANYASRCAPSGSRGRAYVSRDWNVPILTQTNQASSYNLPVHVLRTLLLHLFRRCMCLRHMAY
jgi:hypothetical protein